MLVANQDSNLISIFARDPETGELAEEVKKRGSGNADADSICVNEDFQCKNCLTSPIRRRLTSTPRKK